MKRTRLLESLCEEMGKDVTTRRYSLADMISESYKTIYQCEEGTNLKKLAETHLEDVKKNPRDIERLSRQLSVVKEMIRMEESNELKDEDLVDKKSYDTVEPNEDRVIQDECNESEEEPEADESLKESDDPELTEEELEELAKHLETIRKNRKDTPKNEMTEAEEPKRRGIKCHLADSKKPEEEEIEEAYENEPSDRIVQYGVDIRVSAEDTADLAPVITGALDKVGYEVVGCMVSDTSWSPEEYGLDESKEETIKDCNESYRGLENFKKQSESKAFYKTFKKMHESLKEGKALTRQESIDLYKASNSALTQLSIELEHNPEFLDTFKESVSILSKDVTSVLESLTRGKAPSKKTMKSLAKFSEALLFERGDKFNPYAGLKSYLIMCDNDIIDDYDTEEEANAAMKKLYARGEFKDGELGVVKSNFNEANEDEDEEDIEATEVEEEDEVSDEEAPVDETPEEDFVGDDEGEVQSEEADAFDQEYAEERVELHKELAEEHADDEDPEVQEKIAQDAEEVTNLPGITDEQIAEINGEDSESDVPAEEEAPEEPEDAGVEDDEDSVETEDGDEITDDELEELKSHLKEMRAAKKLKESEEASLVSQVKKALDDAGIRYRARGNSGLVVAKGDLEKASEIRNKIDPEYSVTVAAQA